MTTSRELSTTANLARTVRMQQMRLERFSERIASVLLGTRKPRGQAELIASLNEVADAVSSASTIEQVLECIVERTKRISDTDKAVLVLADEEGGALDLSTIMVRGCREQHLQEWWEDRLVALGERAFATHEVAVEYHPEHSAWILAAPIRVKGHPIGLMCAINADDRAISDTQLDYLAILSAFAASAIENARLAEEGRYVLLASERDRIAREMHDGVIQSLFSISLGLEVCKRQVLHDPDHVSVRLGELQSHLNNSMTELRRFVYDLRPVKLAELGLTGAIEFWIREVTHGTSVKGSLVADWSRPRLSPTIESCLYRVAKESVSNVVRHSGATRFEVTLSGTDELVRLVITDNGHGFEVSSVLAGESPGLGVRSMRDRVAREGGGLTVESSPEHGTSIAVELRPEGV